MKRTFLIIGKYLLIAALLYTPLFGHLDTLPIQLWDESRLASNALEMLDNKNYIIPYYEGKPDMWNTKPPLLIWLQVLFMKAIGEGELALRLPSALAGLFTCIALLVLSKRYLKSYYFGLLAVIVLATSSGYIGYHSTRTGDYDSLLTLFTTLSCFAFFAFCETQKPKYLYGFFVFLSLGVFTKSISGLLFLPGIFIYAMLQKKVGLHLKSKHFYFALLTFLVIVIGYYAWRETQNPGYVAAVQKNELGGRYLAAIEGNGQPFGYYYENLVDSHFAYWILLLPCGILIGLFMKNDRFKKVSLFALVLSVSYFLVISIGKTKLAWYDAPMFPFLAILTAVFLYFIFELLKKQAWSCESLRYNVLPFIFVFLISIQPYTLITDKVFSAANEKDTKRFYDMGFYLKDALKGKHDLNNCYYIFDRYNAHNSFYVKILNNRGVNFKEKKLNNLNKGDIVIAYQDKIKESIGQSFDYKILYKGTRVVQYKIIGKKKPSPTIDSN